MRQAAWICFGIVGLTVLLWLIGIFVPLGGMVHLLTILCFPALVAGIVLMILSNRGGGSR